MSSEILKELGDSASDIIKKAAAVLDEEVAAGMATAQSLERHVREEGDFPAEEYQQIIERMGNDAHVFVRILSAQINEMRSGEYDVLAERFQKNAHEAVDLMLSLMSGAPEIINRLFKTQ